jgi:hypothetical protein
LKKFEIVSLYSFIQSGATTASEYCIGKCGRKRIFDVPDCTEMNGTFDAGSNYHKTEKNRRI